MGPETGPQLSIEQDRASDDSNDSSDSSDNDEDNNSDNYNKENKHEEEEEEEEEGEEEEEEEEVDKGPAKQKRMSLFSTLPASIFSLPFTGKASPVVEPEVVVIACSLAIFPAAEMKKPKTRREAKVRLLETRASMDWVDFRTQLDLQIRDTLYPGAMEIVYSKFEATYTIPRHVPNALPLLASSDYSYLLKNAMKAKDPTVKIVIIETGPQPRARNQAFEMEMENDSDIEPPKKRARKTTVCV
jgi:hypothetical protein